MTLQIMTFIVVFGGTVVLTADAEVLRSDQIGRYTGEAMSAKKICGPVSLAYCLNRLDNDISARQLVAEFDITSEGASVAEIVRQAKRHGFPGAQAISVPSKKLRSLPAPSILLLEGHCVVYDGLTSGNKVRIFEPDELRTYEVDRQFAVSSWTGNAITCLLYTSDAADE